MVLETSSLQAKQCEEGKDHLPDTNNKEEN